MPGRKKKTPDRGKKSSGKSGKPAKATGGKSSALVAVSAGTEQLVIRIQEDPEAARAESPSSQTGGGDVLY